MLVFSFFPVEENKAFVYLLIYIATQYRSSYRRESKQYVISIKCGFFPSLISN